MTNQPRGTLYIGVTSDLIQRVWQHRAGAVEGFTDRYGLKQLVWYEQHQNVTEAIRREKQLKKWNRLWKIRLVEGMNSEWVDLYPVITGEADGNPSR